MLPILLLLMPPLSETEQTGTLGTFTHTLQSRPRNKSVFTFGVCSTCEFTAWQSLTKRKVSLSGTAMAGLAHTAWMFRTIKPNATKAAMHDANHPVFTGSYRRGLAFTACACGLR